MHTAHTTYRKMRTISLTRIEMLVALYDKTLATIETGIEEMKSGQESSQTRLTAYQCVVALLDGISADQDEVARNTHRICCFAASSLWAGELQGWKDAHRVLNPIRNSFHKIREEAIRLENEGHIPALNFQISGDGAVV